MNFSLEHIGLPARNPALLKDWYINTFGAKLIFDNGKTPPAYFVQLPGGVMLEIYECGPSLKETSNNSLAGFRHLALYVDSIEEAKRHLMKKGLRINEAAKPAGGGGRVLFFSDAEQNLLHLVERPKDSVLHPMNIVASALGK